MVKRFLAFLTFVLMLFTACEKKDPGFKVLSKQEMSALLQDIHILEAQVGYLPISLDSQGILYNALLEGVFRDHSITQTDYDSSYSYYMFTDTKALKEIYTAVLDSLIVIEKTDRLKDAVISEQL